MGSFSGLGIGLSFLFGCILLGLVGELYYLLWWKKRFTNKDIGEDSFTKHSTELSYLFCWKKPNNYLSKCQNQELPTSVKVPDANGHEQDPEHGISQDILMKNFGEEGVEAELMRLHNLCGPPRFLFTIKEETREDLESQEGKSRKGSRTRSLSDLVAAGTPFLSPLSSPPWKPQSVESYNHLGFNPLFESSTDAELKRLRSSPPPKFKFLRDAEEKLMRRLMEAAEKKALKHEGSLQDSIVVPLKDSLADSPNAKVVTEERDDTFVTVVSKSKDRELHHQLPQYHSNASQVLPLASSPSTFRPLDNKSLVQ